MAFEWESAPVVEAPQAAPAAPAAVPAAATAPSTAAPAPAKAAWESAPIVDAAPAATPPPAVGSPAQPAATAAPAEQPTVLGELGRQVALTGRAAVKGALALPGVVSDAVTGPINAGLDAVAGEGNGFRFQKVSSAADNLMTGAGVAAPKNATERVVQDIASGLTGTGATIAAGNALAKAASPVTAAVGELLAAAPATQIASTAAGTGAAGVTRESGGGEVAQAVAGLAGALAPSAVPFAAQAGTKAALRGGEAGRQRVAENIKTFEAAAGTTPTIGQATQSRTLQAAETGLSNVIGGSSVMIRRGEAQSKALADSVQELSTALAPNSSGVEAGEAIARGANAFRDNVKVTQQRLYNALDRYIKPDAPITVANTRAAMQELNAGIDGAENLSAWFRNAKLSDLEKSLVADLENAAKTQAPAGSRSGIMNAQGPNLDNAALPYESIKKMRTLVGREMADANFSSEISRDKWSRLYAALSEDLGTTAKAAGPQAEQAWTRANTFTRLASERMGQISSIVNRDAPEKIFKAATTGLSEGGTTINRLMKSLPVENRREVAAAVLQRLGRARPGQQNEVGDAFSSETFLTNLATMSQPARRALFGSSGFSGLEQRINQMGRMASVRREGSQVFANPSGTARQAGMIAWAGALAGALATGNAAAIAGALAAPVAANVTARLATNPERVRALARTTELSAAAGPSAAAAAARLPSGEPDDGQRFRRRVEAERAARRPAQ